MDTYSKRNIVLIVFGMAIAGTLTAWLAVAGVTRYLDDLHADDPMARAGSLIDKQKSQK